MRDFKKLRQGVMKSLPEIQNIKDLELRGKVVEAWALSLSKSSFNRIEETKGSGGPDTPAMKLGSQSDHLRGVAKLAIAILDTLEEMFGSLNVDRDTLWAAGLCHDLGKPFEYDPENRKRWNMDYRISGKPSIRPSCLWSTYCFNCRTSRRNSTCMWRPF